MITQIAIVIARIAIVITRIAASRSPRGWAGKMGAATRALCEAILRDRPHAEQGFRSCLGILRLGERFGDERLEARVCAPIERTRAPTSTSSRFLLKGLDRAPIDESPSAEPIVHENVHGPGEYLH